MAILGHSSQTDHVLALPGSLLCLELAVSVQATGAQTYPGTRPLAEV